MKILSIDTCNGLCSVALQIDNKIMDFICENQISMQSARIFPMIEEILLNNRITYQDLNGIGVNIGPGSFTGVRVGIAAACGLKLVTKFHIYGVSGLLSLACLVKDSHKKILSLMDARRGQLFAQLFDKDKSPLMPASLINYDEASDLMKDDVISIGYDIATGESIAIDAKMVLGAVNHELSQNPSYEYYKPLYIREADAKISPNHQTAI